MKLLHIDSSILGDSSVSRTLSAEIVKAERHRHPDLEVIHRDLASDPVGHLSGAHMAAAQGVEPETPELQNDLKTGQTVLEEFLAADILVVGAPMYNFTVPSQLKAWIDRIAVAGKTFRYGPNGAEGLVGDKKVIVASSRGGFYGENSPGASLDHQENYLRGLFGFLGVTDITFIRAEGVGVSQDQREKSLAAARTEICELAVA